MKRPRVMVSRRVVVVDRLASVFITVGGLAVIVAVLGMIVFIGGEALPLFFNAESGKIEAPDNVAATSLYRASSGKQPVLTACDEYRRVAVAVEEDGSVVSLSLSTGGVIERTRPALLPESSKITASSIAIRARGTASAGQFVELKESHVLLATDTHEVFMGGLAWAADYRRFDIDSIPPELRELKRPAEEEFKSTHYVPSVVIEHGKDGSLGGIVEPLKDFGLYRSIEPFFTLRRKLEVDTGGAGIEAIAGEISAGDASGARDALTVLILADGRVLAVYETQTQNMLTDELETETSVAELTAFIRASDGVAKGRARFACVNEELTDIIVATAEGVVHVFDRMELFGDQEDAQPLREPPFSVLSRQEFKKDAVRAICYKPWGHVEKGIPQGTRHEVLPDRSSRLLCEGPEAFIQVRLKNSDVMQRFDRYILNLDGSVGEADVQTFIDYGKVAEEEYAVHYGAGIDWADWLATRRRALDFPARNTPLRLTAMSYVLGDVSVVFGDSHGGLQSWLPVKLPVKEPNVRYAPLPKESYRERIRLWRAHTFEPSRDSISGFSMAQKSKSFLAADRSGGLQAINMTSERNYFTATAGESGAPLAILASKADGVVAWDANGGLHHWWVEAPHVDVSLKTLFGRVHYESHDKPKAEWQSTSGTDDSEPKLSLMSLLWGTLKGALFALLFSVPLAVLAAVYTSEFMHRNLRGIVKPTVEVMAALPSVVLGFFASLYLAPAAAPVMTTIIVSIILLPASFILFGWFWERLPTRSTAKVGPIRTTLLLFVLLGASAALCNFAGPRLEAFLFPKIEGAPIHLIHPVTFQSLDDETALQLSAGDFRSWTSGGKLEPRSSQSRPHPSGIFVPQGWWKPGGTNLFLFGMIVLLTPLVAYLWRMLFRGASFFGLWIHLLPADNLPSLARVVHPATVGAWSRNRLRGKAAISVRASVTDMVVSGLGGLLILGIAIGLALLLIEPVGSLLCSYDHPLAGRVIDYRRFMVGEEGWSFNQTNSIIVGFVMGFAVIPIIYTISEDALSSVPNQLRSASMACGATPWQTASRVVLPAALPGIFSAVVIGLGRALGETMIVVMAAGATPLTDMKEIIDPLTGFRSLSAAIAIELPEAAQDSTLYRTLFLAGFLLFALSFVINTAAEVVRIRLRKKLARL